MAFAGAKSNSIKTGEWQTLDTESRRYLNKQLVSYMRTGIQLPAEVREKISNLTEKQGELSRSASKNYNEDTTKVECSIEELEGLP